MARQNASLITTVPSSTAPSVVQMVGYGTTAQRPPNPPLGFIYTDITVGQTLVWHGPVIQWLGMGSIGPQGPQGYQGPQGGAGSGIQVYYEEPELVSKVSTGTVSASWEPINFATQLTAFGLTTAQAAILQLETGHDREGGSVQRSCTLRVTGDNSVAVSSDATPRVTETSSRESGENLVYAAINQVTVPFVADSVLLYYNFTTEGTPQNPFARVLLVGFLN